MSAATLLHERKLTQIFIITVVIKAELKCSKQCFKNMAHLLSVIKDNDFFAFGTGSAFGKEPNSGERCNLSFLNC